MPVLTIFMFFSSKNVSLSKGLMISVHSLSRVVAWITLSCGWTVTRKEKTSVLRLPLLMSSAVFVFSPSSQVTFS